MKRLPEPVEHILRATLIALVAMFIVLYWSVRCMADVEPHSSSSLLLVEEMNRYLGEYEGGSRETYRAKKGALEAFGAFLCVRLDRGPSLLRYSDVRRNLIEEYRDARLQTNKASTVAAHVAHLKHFVTLTSNRYAVSNFAKRVSTPHRIEPDFRGLTREQDDALRCSIATLEPSKRYPIALLRATGLRRDEAIGLTLGQVSDDWRFFRNVKGKGSRFRHVMISPKLREDTLQYLDWRQWAPLGPQYPLLVARYRNHADKPNSYAMSDYTLYRRVREVMLATGIPESLCHPHTLRHTFAREFLDCTSRVEGQSKALVLLRDLLGHSSILTTMRYLDHSTEELWEAVRQISI